MYLRGLFNLYRKYHVHFLRTGHHHFLFRYERVRHIHKLYQFAQLVFCRNGAVLQYIGDIRLAQYCQFAAQSDVVQRSAHDGADVHEHFSIGLCVAAFLCVDQFVVLCPNGKVEFYLFLVLEVYCTIQYQGILAGSVCLNAV